MKSLKIALALLLAALAAATLEAQDSLSSQVLQLLARANAWSVVQTYNAGVKLGTFTPSTTTATLYTPNGTDLFWNGALVAGSGSSLAPHNILSVSHADTTAAAVARGDVITGQGVSPTWQRLARGGAGTVLRSDGTDLAWSTDASLLTALNATQLTSGTVPLARLVNITNTEIAAAAAIAWTKLSKTGSSLADLTTRSAADLASGTLADARLSSNVSLFGSSVDTADISDGAVTMAKLAGNGCTTGYYLQWNGSAIACAAVTPGSGTVTSVAASVPAALLAISGSPITTSGTLAITLPTQLANVVFAGPTGGAAVAPAFRALVNADLPLSGVGAGTYLGLTVNTRGVITAQVPAVFGDITGTLTFARGGTGLAAAADDTALVSTGAAWVATAVCNSGVTGALQYTTATNLYSCLANVATTDGVQTLSNKTLHVETAGNVITTVGKRVVRGGKCQNVTATTDWSTPTANAAAPACMTGANTTFGTLDYADGANSLSAQDVWELPSDWSGTISASIVWFTSATVGDVKWQLATACATTTESTDPAWNVADTVVQTAQGTTNRLNEALIAALTTTGCAVGESFFVKFFRDPADGSDTLAATARLVNLELTYRRAQ